MSEPGPIERVVAVLEGAGYEIVEQPRRIGGIPFQFAAMLAGRSSLDLVVLVDLATDTDDDRIRRRVEGLARALDLVRSRRSLTIVLLGPLRSAVLIQAIAGVARILNVGSPGRGDEADLRDALSVLLPLEVATEKGDGADPWAEARAQIVAQHPAETESVVSAARFGKAAVENALRDVLSVPIVELYEVEDEQEGQDD
jgi:hypothetical protein